MKTKNVKIFSFALIALLIYACAGVKVVHTEKKEGFSLTHYKTYGFYKTDIDTTVLPEYNKRIDWIKNELRRRLNQKGLAEGTDPDLLINIGIVIEEKIQTRETDFRTDAPRYMGTRNYSWKSEEVEVGRYHEGTVSIDFVSAANKALVWQGVVQSVIAKSDKTSLKNIAAGGELLFKNID